MNKDEVEIKITSDKIEVAYIESFIQHPSAGGLSIFIGKVRNRTEHRDVKHLEFEAFESMAIKELEKISTTARTQWNVKRICIHHKIGKLEIGDTAVGIGVSAPHRREAIAASTYIIDTLKKTVPIWKKEVFTTGEIWIAAHP